MKPRLFLVAVMVFCGCANYERDSTKALEPKSLGWREMTELVQRRTQLTNIWIHGFQRDMHGQKLFINFSFKQTNEERYQTAIVTSNAFTVTGGAPIVFYNDRGEPIVRLSGVEAQYEADGRLFFRNENANFVFENGARIPYDHIKQIVRVEGGNCILLRFKDRPAWTLSNLANPMEPILNLPPGLDQLECASLRNGRLVILGRAKLPNGPRGVDCLVYDETSSGYKLQEEIPLPWANSAYDFDSESGRAVVAGQAHMFAGYYLFSIQSKHRVWLGFAPSDNVLFLSPGLVRALN